ncbi:ATP-dependent nuclease [Nocardia brasiliensis]|uniref:ATP-dependent nuclease n=1 Tax=Nocardia brasiliensis TaxID=37326 RepID=UPI0024572CCE|nr:AAA family ATPase [Nocardia brasiliensis]
MRLGGIRATGFRNLAGLIPLHGGLAIVVGENNAGKSNLIDACRILFDPEIGPAGRLWISEHDFAHDGRGTRVSDTFELEAQLRELDSNERARMVTCLAPSLGPDCARIRLRATLSGNGKIHTEWFGGDSTYAEIEGWAREAVTFTYLHPLRDAASDLRPGRSNRLAALIGALAPIGHADRSEVENIVLTANKDLRKVGSINKAGSRMQDRLSELTGGGRLAQVTELVFTEPKFDKVIASLRALTGSIGPVEITESGLGYSNLLYMSVLLSALEETTDAALRLLLIEEPEAHLHPQLQDLLMRFLEASGQHKSQVVVTTHSPNLASSAKAERLTVLNRTPTAKSQLIGRCIGDFDLASQNLDHLRRFLDVTKSALLFSRGVILVEGVAEQLLIPAIAERMGLSLAAAGITVVNVEGLAFGPFIDLFGPDRLPNKCAVVSDADPKAIETAESTTDEDSESTPINKDHAPADADSTSSPKRDTQTESTSEVEQLSATARKLKTLECEQVQVFLADKTLEWDLANAGNWDVLLDALKPVKPRVATWLHRDHLNSTPPVRADALLEAVSDKKGRFAQELALLISRRAPFVVPPHIRQAIEWVTTLENEPEPSAPASAVTSRQGDGV